MKRIVAILLVALSLFTCIALMGCDSSGGDSSSYEEKFLGSWGNDLTLFDFQYKDGVYCGSGISIYLGTVVFTKYTATEDTLTIYTESGGTETFDYKFSDGCLYLGSLKFEKFD